MPLQFEYAPSEFHAVLWCDHFLLTPVQVQRSLGSKCIHKYQYRDLLSTKPCLRKRNVKCENGTCVKIDIRVISISCTFQQEGNKTEIQPKILSKSKVLFHFSRQEEKL